MREVCEKAYQSLLVAFWQQKGNEASGVARAAIYDTHLPLTRPSFLGGLFPRASASDDQKCCPLLGRKDLSDAASYSVDESEGG